MTSAVFALSISILFSGCHGKTAVDGDFVQGNTPKTFYKTASSTSATAIITDGSVENTQLIQIDSGQITRTTKTDPSLIQASSDGSIAVISGVAGIYEESKIQVSSIVAGTSTLPPATIDTYCTGLSPTHYQYFKVQYGNTGFQFVAVDNTTQDNIGIPSSVTKWDEGTSTSYVNKGFGTLRISKNLPSPTDNQFYQAAFVGGAPAPWNSIAGMFCRLNDVGFPTYVTNNTPGAGVFMVPLGITLLKVELWGAGGGGGSGDSSKGGGGGGGGAYVGKSTIHVTPGASITYSIGAGGQGGVMGGNTGGFEGGDTSIASLSLLATGGIGGSPGVGGSGGTASGGNSNANGLAGNDSAGIQGQFGGNGGVSPNGGARGVAGNLSTPNGGSGTNPGSGGGGGNLVGSGGNGGAGQIIFIYSAP